MGVKSQSIVLFTTLSLPTIARNAVGDKNISSEEAAVDVNFESIPSVAVGQLRREEEKL